MTDYGRNGAILLGTELKNDMVMNMPNSLICYIGYEIIILNNP